MIGGVAHLAGNSARSPWKGVSVCPANRTTMRKFDDVEACDLLHQVATFYTSTKTPHDYGTGETFTSVELHTLKYIADHPGIAAVQIADDFGKTKSAVSQLLKKLEHKGLLVKTPSPDADHHQLLELSERGVQVNEAHKRYDAAHFGESMAIVREQYSDEQIDQAFEVLTCWLKARREVHKRRLARQRQNEPRS